MCEQVDVNVSLERTANVDTVVALLEERGLRVTQVLEGVRVISGRVAAVFVAELRGVPGVRSVELDRTAHATV